VVGAAAGGLLLLGAALVGWQLLTTAFPSIRPGGDPRAAATAGTGDSPTATGAPSGQPVRIAAAQDFDPGGDPPEENRSRVGRAVDGDPSTTWSTSTYFDPLELQKPGVGLWVDLGSAQQVASLRLRLVGSGASAQVRVAPEAAAAAPAALAGWRQAAERTGLGETAVIELDRPANTRFVLVWFTALPPVGGDYKVEVAEVEVRS
jgi:putative peptidoglycan lipid II flippase